MDLRIMVEPQQGATYDEQLRLARHVEGCGFGAFFRSDHYLRIGAGDPGPGPTDSWVTLAGLARETRSIRLGSMVSSATFRLPALLAVQAAQVDVMSNGRLELGLGAGWFEPEHRAYGIPFFSASERAGRWEEQLAIITGLWSTPHGETFSYAGQYYKLEACPALPRPVQQPRPPIIIGGKGQHRTPRLAARYADEFNIAFDSLENEAAQFERVRSACADAGRDPETIVLSVAVTTALGRNPKESRRRAERIGDDVERLRAGPGLVGTVEDALGRINAYEGIGVTRLYLQMKDLNDLDHLELIAEKILPYVGAATRTLDVLGADAS